MIRTRTGKARTNAAKNPFAVGLAKRRAEVLTKEERSESARTAGLAGGPARARKLSAKRRKEIAAAAARARWAKS